MIETGTLLQGRYLIEKQIGAGGMGAVYLAVDERFGNHVALKETFYKDQEFDAAFEREARLLNGLNHSALPHVSDYFTENGEYFLVMQYIEGEDLFESLKQKKQFSIETVLRWTNDLLDALDYLHSQNPPIIHRDIKPQNLKITTRDNIVLLDFGLAKLNSEDSTAQSVFGYSRRYSPLEQIQGIGTDARSDIFSLAATVYHLLTNEPPIDALNRAAAIVAGKPDPLKKACEINRQISANVSDVIDKALALNAAERFESAQAMCDALKSSSNGENISIVPDIPANDYLVENSSINQKFPALDAFAAGNKAAENNANSPNEKMDAKKSFVPVESAAPPQFASTPHNDLTEIPTKVSFAPRKKSRLPFALSGLVLLLCAGLTAGYFINQSRTPTQTTDAQTIQPTETQTTLPMPEVSNTNSAIPVNAAPEQTLPEQTMNVSQTENSDVKKEVAKTEKPEKSSVASAKKETVRQNSAAPRPESENNGETRERIVEDEPVRNISDETDKGARRKQQRKMRQQRDNQIINMTADEWRDYQRHQRRQRPVDRLPF